MLVSVTYPMRYTPEVSTLPRVVIGIFGTRLDAGMGSRRWDRWRPTVSLFQHADFPIARLELLVPTGARLQADRVVADIRSLAPKTEIRLHPLDFADPWDFEEVYSQLYDFARAFPFRPDEEQYEVHITTGTHVAQICLFLLTETRVFPGRLLQTGPPRGAAAPHLSTIDLDLARYDRLAARFEAHRQEGRGILTSGIATRNPRFNGLIDQIERVAGASTAPLLLLGPTGAGKSLLARKIYALRQARRMVSGPLVEVNCATLRGDGAMSALFGHARGAFTGADRARQGLLQSAHGGCLFLDEIGELGLDEQAMLLRALEEHRFLPLGSDKEVESRFQLLAGTNRDLHARVAEGRFREDLLARIHTWTFRLPSLAERREDIEPNVDYELERSRTDTGRQVRFSREARARFLGFAATAPWPGNFRDLNAAVMRMATLAPGGRIDLPTVEDELARLRAGWGEAPSRIERLLGAVELDRFDRVQLEDVLAVCATSRSLSEAGRALYATSRLQKASHNDADRLRKYLARFGIGWDDVQPPTGTAR